MKYRVTDRREVKVTRSKKDFDTEFRERIMVWIGELAALTIPTYYVGCTIHSDRMLIPSILFKISILSFLQIDLSDVCMYILITQKKTGWKHPVTQHVSMTGACSPYLSQTQRWNHPLCLYLHQWRGRLTLWASLGIFSPKRRLLESYHKVKYYLYSQSLPTFSKIELRSVVLKCSVTEMQSPQSHLEEQEAWNE